VVPFDIRAMGLEQAFVTGGGYKYCQLGEGNCFLRVPRDCGMRPVLTGWFAEFAALQHGGPREVEYGTGAAAFGGATYDPTAHYRAAAVFDFHVEQGLTPGKLRDISRHQTGLLKDGVQALDLDPAVARVDEIHADRRAGFLAIRSPRAAELHAALRRAGVLTDFRGERLRLGPAPYLTDDQLRAAVAALGSAARA
jgi:kynureninase